MPTGNDEICNLREEKRKSSQKKGSRVSPERATEKAFPPYHRALPRIPLGIYWHLLIKVEGQGTQVEK